MAGPRKKFGQCPKCGTRCHLSVHHLHPKRFFRGRGPIALICRTCHDELETFIPRYERMPKAFYELVYEAFINQET